MNRDIAHLYHRHLFVVTEDIVNWLTGKLNVNDEYSNSITA